MRLLKWLAVAIVSVVGLVLGVAPTGAQGPLGLDEVRAGPAISGGELYPGTIVIPVVTSFSFSNLESAQFDLYWDPFPNLYRFLGSPRPYLGGIVSFGGRESALHGGVQWHVPIGRRFYLESSVGYGIHNGALSGAVAPYRNLGCRTLVHWSYGAGAQITENITVTAQLQHMSNVFAGCSPNDGMNHFGVSVGWKF